MIHDEQEQWPAVRGWRDQAACRGTDPELYFPIAESGPAHDAQVAAAKAVCAGCSVRAECLVEALARIPYGIAGGLTEQERRRQRRDSPAASTTALLDEVLVDGLPPGITAQERAGVGRLLLGAGRSTQQVATDCGVSSRTAERWATTTSTSTSAGEGSRGGHRAPLRTSHPHNPQPGTRAAEGPRG